MAKKSKGEADRQLSESVQDSAHLIWLAGLGAFAKVGEEGSKLFEKLIKEGEKVEKKARDVAAGKLEEAQGKVDKTRNKVADTWDKVEQLFEDRLTRVLSRLGVPNRDELQELSRRVDELQEMIKAVGAESQK
ncbi:MAG: phasin family protein [Candidatus Contendobacter sp.]|jgi:poly(hydroxyalkanoate) granule-associated protein|nr:phasin family protein [Gammaproteobacteria bacterium]MCC8994754.1 phasin family protein [Candidatus Contendobacter sp.]